MTDSSSSPKPHAEPNISLRSTLIYAFCAALIILGGDWLLERLAADQLTRVVLDACQGMLFVGVTSFLLYRLLHGSLRDMRAAEQRYREVVDNASDIVYTLDLEGRFTSVNPAAERVLGYSPDSLIGKSLPDLIPLESHRLSAMRDLKLFEGIPQTVYELKTTTADGQRIVLEVNSRLIYQKGQPIGVHGVARDVTARKRVEAALQASEAQLRALFAAMTDLILIIDDQGYYREIIPTNPQLLYRSPDQLLGKRLHQIFPAEQADRFLAAVREALAQHRAVNIEYCLLIGGRDTWAAASISPLDESTALWAARDITARKQIEADLAHARDALQSLMDNMLDTIYFKDTASRFTRINHAQARVLGITDVEAALGKTDADFFTPDLATQFLAEERIIFETGQPVLNREEYNPLPDGQPRWFLASKSPLFDPSGRITGLVGISRDITTLKLREREFEVIATIASAVRTLDQVAAISAVVVDQVYRSLRVDEVALGRQLPQSGAVVIDAARGSWEYAVNATPPAELQRVPEVLLTGCISVSTEDTPDAVRYIAIAPLVADDQPIGVLAIGRRTPISTAEQQLLIAIGDIVASAVQRAVAHAQLKRRTEQLAALNMLSRDLAELLDVSQVYERSAQAINQLLPGLAALLISVYDSAHQVITCAYALDEGKSMDVQQLPPLPLGQGPQSETIRTRQVLIVNDFPARMRIGRLITVSDERIAQSALYAPMVVKDDVIGIVQVQSFELNRFTAEDAELLTAIANTTAVALQNARLFEAEREQRALAEALRDTAAALNSTLNVDEVLDRVLATIGPVLPYDTANIMLIDHVTGVARVARAQGYDRISPQFDLAVRQLAFPIDSVLNLRQMIETGQPYIIADTRTYPGWVDSPYTRWQRSSLGAPICIRDTVEGFINLDNRTAGFFTTAHAERLQAFANQAATAITNARLFEAEREQRAVSEVLRETASGLTSTLDRDEVLDRILSHVGRIVPNDMASILLIDDGAAVVARNLGEIDSTRDLPPLRLPINETPTLRRMVKSGQPQLIADVQTDSDWITLPGHEWIRSCVAAPLLSKGAIIGLLSLYSQMAHFYTPLHVDRLQLFAAQASLALENAQLFEETQQRVKELAVLFDSSMAFTSTLDRAEVLKIIPRRMAEAVDATSVYLLSIDLEAARATVLTEYFGPDANELEREPDIGTTYSLVDLPQTIDALRHGRPAITIIDQSDAEPVALAQLQHFQSQSSLRVPMIFVGRVLGYAVIWDSRSPRHWTDAEIRLTQTLANQAAVALENVRLLAETQQRLKEQTALLAAGTAVSSSLDLPTILRHLAEQMGHAIDATSVYVCEWDQQAYSSRVVAEYYSPAASDLERVSDLGVDYELITDYGEDLLWTRPGEAIVSHIDDADLLPFRRDHLRNYGCQSVLTLGLIAKANVFGYVELWETRHRREFTPEEIALCQAMAQQTAIAFENARLFEAERKQLRLAQTLQAVGALLTAELGMDEVYQHLFDLLAQVVAYDSVSVQLLDDQQLYMAAGRGFPDSQLTMALVRQIPPAIWEARWGRPQQSVFVIADTYGDPNWLILAGSEYIRSWIGAPLRVKGQLLGILNVDSRTVNAYNEEIGQLVAAFANQAAVALENARLNEASRRHAFELEERVKERTAELDRERRRTGAI
ncbi:MAG: GAF domain-containing protein, partial [Anaerolineae bacterium]